MTKYYVQDEKDIAKLMTHLKILDIIVYEKPHLCNLIELNDLFFHAKDVRYVVHQNGDLGIINKKRFLKL